MATHMMRTNSPRIDSGLGGKSGGAGRGGIGGGGLVFGLFNLLARLNESRRQRRALQTLDDNMLRDIGLSRADVEREATKPFWMI